MLAHQPRARRSAVLLTASLGLVLAALLALAPAAPAAARKLSLRSEFRPITDAPIPGNPVLVSNPSTPPAGGYRLTATRVERIAARAPKVRAMLRHHPRLIPYEYTKGYPYWQVSWFTPPTARGHQRELIQVYVDDYTGTVAQVWTGPQVAWTMARGYPGAFGEIVNAWWLWLAMCALFIAPFIPWPLHGPHRHRPTLLHLDLLMLLGFSISLAFFNHGEIGISVPLVYPFLLYLLARMALLGFGKGRPREPLRAWMPTWALVALLALVVGGRIALNLLDSNVIDVGYAGVIGASRLLHGHALYGHFPADNPNGDTYGPVNYYAYLPATALLGWSGTWDSLPAAHGSAIAFDLLTLLGLLALGWRLRRARTGIVLAYLWAAYPFTTFALSSNSNDALVAATLVLTLLVASWAPARGGMAAVCGLTKLAPLALAPLLWRGSSGRRPSAREMVLYGLAFAAVAVASFMPVILDGSLPAFWRDAIVYQLDRKAPFSIWGLYGGLGLARHLVEGLVVGLAIAVAFMPRRRTLVQVAALGAAVMIALQLAPTYWFYLYILWFYALVVVAVGCALPTREAVWPGRVVASGRPAPAPAATRSISLASVRPSGSAPR